jgi:hypothetical protein
LSLTREMTDNEAPIAYHERAPCKFLDKINDIYFQRKDMNVILFRHLQIVDRGKNFLVLREAECLKLREDALAIDRHFKGTAMPLNQGGCHSIFFF